jgi:hypothetical protein
MLVGDGAAQHLVVAGDELDLDAGERGARQQRTHRDVQPVRAHEGGQPEVGDDHPLGGAVIVVVIVLVLVGPGHAGDDQIDARQGRDQHLVDRDAGDDLAVFDPLHRHPAVPDRLADGVANLAHVPAVQRVADAAAHHLGHQVAVVDAQHLDVDQVEVDRSDRHRAGAAGGQHIGRAVEGDRLRPILDRDRVGEVGIGPLLAVGGGQAGQHRYGIALPVAQPVDAERIALDRQLDRNGRLDPHVGAEIGGAAGRQRV